MPPRRHLAPGPTYDSQPLFPVVVRFLFIEIGKVTLQEHHTGDVFQQLGIGILAQLALGQNGFHLLALGRLVATVRHDLGGPAPVHATAGLAPLVVRLSAFRVIRARNGPAFDVLGPAGNLHTLGGLRFQREQPAGHVLAVRVLPRQRLAIDGFPVRVGAVGAINLVQCTGQLCRGGHAGLLSVVIKAVILPDAQRVTMVWALLTRSSELPGRSGL